MILVASDIDLNINQWKSSVLDPDCADYFEYEVIFFDTRVRSEFIDALTKRGHADAIVSVDQVHPSMIHFESRRVLEGNCIYVVLCFSKDDAIDVIECINEHFKTNGIYILP
jgi:hypothetical protein